MPTLLAEKRDIFGKKLAKARGAGKLPVVLYGGKEKPASLFVGSRDFKKLWKEAGESTLVTLKTPDGEKAVLIHEASFHPVTGEPVHADFYVVDTEKPIELKVPIEFVGESAAVKSLGGILVKVLHEMNISALPKNIPHSIAVDLSALQNLDSRILAKDLKLPAGVRALLKPDEIVAAIGVAKEEAEEVPPVDLSAIEVEKKGREEKEGEEGEAPTSEGVGVPARPAGGPTGASGKEKK